MTGSTQLRSVVGRLVAVRTKALIAATATLVIIGLIAALTDHYALALVTVLLLQACLAGYLVTAPSAGGSSEAIQRHIDQGSARTLADLSRARHAILEAIDALDARSDR